MLRFKVLYDRKLHEMSKQWVEFFNNYAGELDAKLTKLEMDNGQ